MTHNPQFLPMPLAPRILNATQADGAAAGGCSAVKDDAARLRKRLSCQIARLKLADADDHGAIDSGRIID